MTKLRGCDSILITLAYILNVLFLSGLLAFFDMKLFNYSFLTALEHLYFSEVSAGRYIVLIGGFVGIVSSIIIDVRLHLSNKGNVERN